MGGKRLNVIEIQLNLSIKDKNYDFTKITESLFKTVDEYKVYIKREKREWCTPSKNIYQLSDNHDMIYINHHDDIKFCLLKYRNNIPALNQIKCIIVSENTDVESSLKTFQNKLNKDYEGHIKFKINNKCKGKVYFFHESTQDIVSKDMFLEFDIIIRNYYKTFKEHIKTPAVLFLLFIMSLILFKGTYINYLKLIDSGEDTQSIQQKATILTNVFSGLLTSTLIELVLTIKNIFRDIKYHSFTLKIELAFNKAKIENQFYKSSYASIGEGLGDTTLRPFIQGGER
ncbi:MAG: hypothetical protein K0R07_889 [Sedimentibacter sp.]|jgi:hypothetical protein|nr:hypothetical protein [Sedimentibacter sp.]